MNELWVPQRAVAARLQCDECDCDGSEPLHLCFHGHPR